MSETQIGIQQSHKLIIGVGVALVAAVWMIATWFFSGLDFEVSARTGYPGAVDLEATMPFLKVHSRNEKKLTVRTIVVNDDEGCMLPEFGQPISMALGQTFSRMLLCEPAKVTISTDKGEAVYWMKR